MFTNITWATYLTVVAITIFIWYAVLGSVFYFGSLKIFFKGKRKLQFGPNLDLVENHEDFSNLSGPSDHTKPNISNSKVAFNDFDMIEELVDRVKSLIDEALEKQMPKEGFFSLISKILSDYPLLNAPEIRPSVNEFIFSECENKGLPNVTMGEVEALWKH